MKWNKKSYQLEWNEKTNMIGLYNTEGEYIFSFPFNARLLTTDGEYVNLFSRTERENRFPAHGVTDMDLPSGFRLENDEIVGNMKSGELYTFVYKEDNGGK